VDDADAFAGDAGGQVSGQRIHPPHQIREPCGGRAQPRDDLVGAVDDVVADVVGVGAATPHVFLGGELGLDVALDRAAGQDSLADGAKVVGIGVQPVEVPVEHDRRRATGFAVGQVQHGPQGEQVAVQAADHVQGVGLQPRRLGEDLRLGPVAERAGASANLHTPPSTLQGQPQVRCHDGLARLP
jgi:hypothetical protein